MNINLHFDEFHIANRAVRCLYHKAFLLGAFGMVESSAVRTHESCAAYHSCKNAAYSILADEASFSHSYHQFNFSGASILSFASCRTQLSVK
jgi:hypothetical protein